MAEKQDLELISFHRYIKNTYTNGTIYTEHLLNIDKRPQLSKRARKAQHNKVGQKNKETKNERERHWMGPVFQGGSCEGGKVPACWEVFSPVGTGVTEGISWDRGKTPVCGGQESYLHRQLALPPVPPILRCSSTGMGSSWVLKLKLQVRPRERTGAACGQTA